jgi:hypothetical protein
MQDKVFESFLRRQAEEGLALARSSDLLELMPLEDSPPCRYMARFAANGLVRSPGGDVVEATGCDIGIWFPPDYLRRVDVAQVFTYLGPPRPWHPNIRPPFICLHVTAGTPLVDLLYSLYELWTWNLYYTGDEGLNHSAAQWARQQKPTRFPVDRRPLRRRALDFQVEIKKRGERT